MFLICIGSLVILTNSGSRTASQEEDLYITYIPRANFALSMLYVSLKKHEDDLRREAIAKKLSENNPRAMWSEVNSINNSKIPLPTRIDDATGNENILKLWKNHFQSLFNCINNSNTMNKKLDVNCS